MTQRLRLVFEDPEGFRQEYERNMSAGGAFVHTDAQPDLREIVEVEIALQFCHANLVLEAEVVHAMPGAVAVQFLEDTSVLRQRFEEAVAELSMPPRPARRNDPRVEPDAPPRTAPQSTHAAPSHDGENRGDPLFDSTAPDLGLEQSALSVSPPASGAAAEPPLDAGVPLVEPELEVQAEFTAPGFDPHEVPPDPGDDGAGLEIDLDDLRGVLDEDEHVGGGEGDPLAESGEPVLERRGDSRSRASVPARLVTPDFHLEGHTRDLSETGVLISADASELPIGKEVRLRLQSPESGEHIEVAGRVSRHVEADGTVAAVAVEFEPESGQESLLSAFVKDVRQHIAERQERGISGVIEELGMPSLVQMLGSSSPEGTLIARHGPEEGIIAFAGGRLRYARLGLLRSTKALARMVAWQEGHFDFFASVDPLDDEDEPLALDAAILEAVRQLDEAARVDVPLEMSTSFGVDRSAHVPDADPSKIEEAVLDLAEAGFTLRRIVDVIPESDAEILGAVHALVDLEVLLPS